MAVEKTIKLQNTGACLIRFNKVDVVPEGTFEVTEAQLNSQAIKYLFNRGEVQFEDDPKRTRDYLAKIRENVKPKVEKTLAERENGGVV